MLLLALENGLENSNCLSRLAVISMGTENIGKGKFREEIQLLALPIGSEGMEVLESVGFDLNSQNTDAYDVALNHLKNYYDHEENEHVAWVKAATLSQLCDESDSEFLLRDLSQAQILM